MTTLSIPVPMQLVVIALLSILSICIYQSCSQSTVSKSITSQSTVSLNNSSCKQSLVESDGFICEPDYLWNERKYVYHAQDKENMMKRKDPIYFVSNWEPNFYCSHAQRIGAMGDGGKWVCDPYRLKLRPDCLMIFGKGIEPNGSRSWLTIVQELNHTNRLIDILKIDIEGGEYSFFPLVFNFE
ncbi:unnamed protein product [Rotaria sordida]|uniref:Methyltransferase domain-containing protein n=1 Tax=Rotaria sordida TaxID=392033 RepID=A0A815QTH6_9BILA|nr:unnamed protein product [Rotaria sordida]CAF4092484.1 unnamed protein product [Rotaria sordida]